VGPLRMRILMILRAAPTARAAGTARIGYSLGTGPLQSSYPRQTRALDARYMERRKFRILRGDEPNGALYNFGCGSW
jgi:hypothetical protein